MYHIPHWSKSVPFFQALRPVGVIYSSSLNVTPQDFREGFPGVTDRFEWFAIDYSGRFWIEKPGWYRFALTSDDGSLLYIDDQLTVDNDGVHPPETKMASVKLSGGIHRIRVSYFQGPRFQVALILQVAGPGEDFRIFSTDEFKPPPNPETWAYTDAASAAGASMIRLELQTAPERASPGADVRVDLALQSQPGDEPIALSWLFVVPAEVAELKGRPQLAGATEGSNKSVRCFAATKVPLFLHAGRRCAAHRQRCLHDISFQDTRRCTIPDSAFPDRGCRGYQQQSAAISFNKCPGNRGDPLIADVYWHEAGESVRS